MPAEDLAPRTPVKIVPKTILLTLINVLINIDYNNHNKLRYLIDSPILSNNITFVLLDRPT